MQNLKEIGKMITIKVIFADGNSLVTGFNGTLADAQAYYVGRRFNNGRGAEDNLVGATEVIPWEKSLHYFDTGVRPHSVSNWKLYAGHVVHRGTAQIPFECMGVPAGADFLFACDHPKLKESESPGVIVREILPGAMVSKYAYFRTK